jgi:hypothetical protein
MERRETNRLNLFFMFGDEEITVHDLKPSSIAALRLLFTVCGAILTLQTAFRGRIAYRNLNAKITASVMIQRWFRNGRVRRNFIRILDALESDGMKGEDTIRLEDEIDYLGSLSMQLGENMTHTDPKSRLKYITESWGSPKQRKFAKPTPETRAFVVTSKKTLDSYSLNSAGVIEVSASAIKRKGTPPKNAKPTSPAAGTKPTTPKKAGKKAKEVKTPESKSFTTRELIKSGVPENLSITWALAELKKL